MTVSANHVSGTDIFFFTDQLGISGSFDFPTGTLTLTGSATVANYETALRTVAFRADGDDLPATKTIQFTVDDGVATSAPATKVFSITSINDAPVLTVTGSVSAQADRRHRSRQLADGSGRHLDRRCRRSRRPDLGNAEYGHTLARGHDQREDRCPRRRRFPRGDRQRHVFRHHRCLDRRDQCHPCVDRWSSLRDRRHARPHRSRDDYCERPRPLGDRRPHDRCRGPSPWGSTTLLSS